MTGNLDGWEVIKLENFIYSINVTLPIFLVMVIGYILKQTGMLNDNFVTVANRFNFKVT